MSYELDYIKGGALGGTPDSWPSDKEFVQRYGYDNVFEFFNKFWKTPFGCYFAWIPDDLIEKVRKIDNEQFSRMSELKKTKQQKKGWTLCNVGNATFFHLKVKPTRKVIGGETGFEVIGTYKEGQK